MRRNNKEHASKRGKKSAEADHNIRLHAALNYEPIRPVESHLIYEVRTFNPVNGARNLLELKHEINNGSNRFNLYINGVKQRKQWSRTRFVNCLFNKIEAVRSEW